MILAKLIGASFSDAMLLCDHYNYKLYVIREDGDYFLVPTSYDGEQDRIGVVIEHDKIIEAKFI